MNDEVRGNAVSAGVPTAAEKRGDFSQSDPACRPIPIDPLTGQPFPGNVIPPERIGEAGQALLQLYPDANVTGCLNWVTALDVPVDWRQINSRLDWNITDRARFMIRYTEDDWQNPSPTAGGANGLWGDDPFPAIDSAWAYPGLSLVAQLNNVIGDSALNTLTFSLSGNEVETDQVGDTGLQEQIRATNPPTFPAEDKLAYPQVGHPTFYGGGGLGYLGQHGPWFNVQLRLEIFNLFNTVNLIGWSADTDFNPPVTLDAPRDQATVVTSTGDPASTFGLATRARNARQIQLGVKLTF